MTAIVLNKKFKSPFKRTIDNDLVVFENNQPVELKPGQLSQVRKDIGAAPVVASSGEDGKFDYDWESTRQLAIENGNTAMAAGGDPLKVLTVFEIRCLRQQDADLSPVPVLEPAKPEPEPEPAIDLLKTKELAEIYGVSGQKVSGWVKRGMPKQDGGFDLEECFAWLVSEEEFGENVTDLFPEVDLAGYVFLKDETYSVIEIGGLPVSDPVDSEEAVRDMLSKL